MDEEKPYTKYGVASDSKMSQPRADYHNSLLHLPNLNA